MNIVSGATTLLLMVLAFFSYSFGYAAITALAFRKAQRFLASIVIITSGFAALAIVEKRDSMFLGAYANSDWILLLPLVIGAAAALANLPWFAFEKTHERIDISLNDLEALKERIAKLEAVVGKEIL